MVIHVNQYAIEKVSPTIAKITNGYGAPCTITKNKIESAIETITNNRSSYATDEAWQRHLLVYQTALATLEDAE